MGQGQTERMDRILRANPEAPVHIISGEGEGPGTVEVYEGAHSADRILRRLAKERCGGDRWAKAVIGTDLDNGNGIDLSTGDYCVFPDADE